MSETRPPRVVQGDCIEIMRMLPDNSIDAIVTDPPYGLGFMGAKWDALPPGEDWAIECLRVLKPGGHILAFGGTRTWHRLAVAIEDAGFEIRDSLYWHYGSGFPKSHDVSKAMDRTAGAEREVIGIRDDKGRASTFGGGETRPTLETAPATSAAKQWQGWGTALKPATEPIILARKPIKGTVAANVQEWGTGALNIDGSRIGTTVETWPKSRSYQRAETGGRGEKVFQETGEAPAGRWPSNVILDPHMAAVMDGQSGVTKDGVAVKRNGGGSAKDTHVLAGGWQSTGKDQTYGASGGASRFFKVIEPDAPFVYMAKAPKKERPVVDGVAHPTVKPLSLLRWLVKLVCPPGGTVLEPFAGSGTTVEACMLEGFHCIAIEREAEYLPLIQARIDRQDAA